MASEPDTLVRFSPDYVLPPGAHLAEKLEELDMTQAELADRTGLSRKHVSQLINGEATLSTEVAVRLERVTAMPAHLWSRLEASYRTWLTEQEESERLESSEAISWAEQFPHVELVRRGHIPEGGPGADLVRRMLEFFGVASHDAWKPVMLERLAAASYRKATGTSKSEATIATWLRICERRATEVEVADYDRHRFLDVVHEARHSSIHEPRRWWLELIDRFASAGVALVLEPEFKGATQLNGASWWAHPRKAVVALSGRRKRADGLFFTMLHESVHILKHSKKQTFIDILNGDMEVDNQLERDADEQAASLLIHPDEWEWISKIPKRNPYARIHQAASRINVHPGIIVGQLQARAWSNGYGTAEKLKQRLDLEADFWRATPTGIENQEAG